MKPPPSSSSLSNKTKSNESGANAEIGRVHGWINAPVNAWLKEDRREPGDGNRERFWKTGRVNAK